jgi:exoribonuclease-2
MRVGGDGIVAGGEVYRARVRNRAKLAYNAVAAWLDGRGPLPPAGAAVKGLDANLQRQDAVAQAMKAERHRRGSLALHTMEARAVFDGDALTDLQPDEENRARQLIEDFMIAANGVTAKFLAARGVASLRRILKAPERWDRIVVLAAEHGERLPATPDAAALATFLVSRRDADPETFDDLSLAVVKLLGAGEYILERRTDAGRRDGHFGLGVAEYAHATAPNRRFVDLVTQRLSKGVLDGRDAGYDETTLAAIARHCTEQEDAARKVERAMRKRAAAAFMAERVGDSFPAMVTGASPKGTYVRLLRPPIEGRVVRGEGGLDVGDTVRVRLISADPETGHIDFENPAGADTPRKLERSRRKKRAAVRLAGRIGETFDAVVTKAAPDGTYVRLANGEAEGRVVRGYHGLVKDQRVRVKLVATDPVHGFIDFEYAPGVPLRKRRRTSRKRRMAAALQERIGEAFDAVVTGVTDKATWIRTAKPRAEGRLVRGREGLAVGDRVRVVLLDADPERGWIDFARDE